MDSSERVKILSGVFGEPYRKTEDLKGIPVVLRTLYDVELQDALSRSLKFSNVEAQLFAIKRWKLAYALLSLNEVEMPTDVEEAYKIIAGSPTEPTKFWPSYFVEQLYRMYEDACDEEAELGTILKKSSGTDELTTESS